MSRGQWWTRKQGSGFRVSLTDEWKIFQKLLKNPLTNPNQYVIIILSRGGKRPLGHRKRVTELRTVGNSRRSRVSITDKVDNECHQNDLKFSKEILKNPLTNYIKCAIISTSGGGNATRKKGRPREQVRRYPDETTARKFATLRYINVNQSPLTVE